MAKPYWSTYKQLEHVILAGEGKDYQSSHIPIGFAPSDSLSRAQTEALAARRLPQHDLDDEDLAARKEMEDAMREFGIAEPEAEAHRQARQADPHLQRHESGSTSQAGDLTPPLDRTGPSSPESSLRPLSLAASAKGSPPMLPPRPSLELETGRPLPPPRCDSESNQSPMLVEVGEGEAPPFEEARRSLEMSRQSSESARLAEAKPPVPPRRLPRVGALTVEATTAVMEGSPVVAQEGGKEEEATAVEGEAVAGSAVAEEETEVESDATSFVDAESTTGTVTEEGAEEEDDEVATVVAKID